MTTSNGSTYTEVPASVRVASALADTVLESTSSVRRLFAALRRDRQRRETLRQLRALDDRLLADIGLSRADMHEVVDRLIRRQA